MGMWDLSPLEEPMTVSPPPDAPPMNGEALPLEFANTVYPARGSLLDTFRSVEMLAWWLRACEALNASIGDDTVAAITDSDLKCFVRLRDASRRLIDAHVRSKRPDPWDVDTINQVASLGHTWPALSWSSEGSSQPLLLTVDSSLPLVAVQSEIARQVVLLLAGTLQIQPRACEAPGCIFFFDASRSRRRWCSQGCGNRARAARHYSRHHARQGDEPN